MASVSFPNRPSIKILVVEENDSWRQRAVEIVGDAGFLAVDADDGLQALALIERDRDIDILLTAVDIPGQMGGLQLVVNVHRAWPNMAIVITSELANFRQSTLPTRCRLVRKPYDGVDLIGSIARLTGR